MLFLDKVKREERIIPKLTRSIKYAIVLIRIVGMPDKEGLRVPFVSIIIKKLMNGKTPVIKKAYRQKKTTPKGSLRI
jgi:hypothetical protein